jgi:hypothetical protein
MFDMRWERATAVPTVDVDERVFLERFRSVRRGGEGVLQKLQQSPSAGVEETATRAPRLARRLALLGSQ